MFDIQQAVQRMRQKLCDVERGSKRKGDYIRMSHTREDRFETFPRNLTQRDLLADDWKVVE